MYSAISGGDSYTALSPFDLKPPYTNMEYLPTYLTVDPTSNTLTFSGANIYVNSGTNATEDTTSGLGNIIIGYDENDGTQVKVVPTI